jgi:hypothetical protein|tara:strand:- start:337 stop:1173 length:837 start_codon:yes stop_codon:yes gene_type:complete
MSDQANPLSKYFRKPTIYVQIPTGGRFNPEIDKTLLDEIPVMPMTAIDEITMQNPDALLNGEALMSVIASCIPTIPDPRNLCSIDADLLFLAIKYATYGKTVTHLHTCTECKEQAEYNIDINNVLEKFPEIHEVEPIEHEDLKIYITPPRIESMTRLALIDVEQQRILQSIQAVGEDEITEMELAKQFAISFRKVSKQNVDLLISSINRIETPDTTVTDEENIIEFMNNVPSLVVKEVNDKVKLVTKKPEDLTTFEFACEACEHKDKINFELNPVNFS